MHEFRLTMMVTDAAKRKLELRRSSVHMEGVQTLSHLLSDSRMLLEELKEDDQGLNAAWDNVVSGAVKIPLTSSSVMSKIDEVDDSGPTLRSVSGGTNTVSLTAATGRSPTSAGVGKKDVIMMTEDDMSLWSGSDGAIRTTPMARTIVRRMSPMTISEPHGVQHDATEGMP